MERRGLGEWHESLGALVNMFFPLEKSLVILATSYSTSFLDRPN